MENALYKKGTGYTVRVKKPFKLKIVEYNEDGRKVKEREKIEYAEYDEYFPPDVTAQIFWLKNRKPDEWRDRRETPQVEEQYEDDGFVTALTETAKQVFGQAGVEIISDKEREAADEADKTTAT